MQTNRLIQITARSMQARRRDAELLLAQWLLLSGAGMLLGAWLGSAAGASLFAPAPSLATFFTGVGGRFDRLIQIPFVIEVAAMGMALAQWLLLRTLLPQAASWIIATTVGSLGSFGLSSAIGGACAGLIPGVTLVWLVSRHARGALR
jgi:F0F1-type ATP synthase assembly protein I